MLQWLASFLTAPIINGFLDAYKARLDAKSNAGAQAVEVTRAALIAEIEARKSANAMLIAEQGRWYTAIIRPLLALPVIIYLWKVIVLGYRARARQHRPDRRRCRRMGRLYRHDLCRRPLAREDRQDDMGPDMTAGRSNERLAILEQKVSHMEEELDKMSAKVDEMHAILLQARGVRWAIIAVSGLVGFIIGASHWLISRA
jgi:hypothetical protein